MPMPADALCSTVTRCPCVTNSRTPAGVRPTRYSWGLISLGTPICTRGLLSGGERELFQVRHIVILHIDLEGGQYAHHRIVEADDDRQVNDLFVPQFLLQCRKSSFRHCTVQSHLACGPQNSLCQIIEFRRLACAVVDQGADVALTD